MGRVRSMAEVGEMKAYNGGGRGDAGDSNYQNSVSRRTKTRQSSTAALAGDNAATLSAKQLFAKTDWVARALDSLCVERRGDYWNK